MSDILSIGASGLRAYQTALTTVSENIANAGTEGYVRRTTALREIRSGSGGTIANGMGVVVNGIVRNATDTRATAVRNAGSDLGRTQAAATQLEGIQSALSDNALSTRITDFFNAATQLAADPTAGAPRAAMLAAGSSVASAFQATGRALDGVVADLDATAETAVTQLNNLSASLARVNSGIARSNAGTSGNAQLLDDRDRLLEQMGAITDVTVQFDSIGRAMVRGGDSSGPPLVSGDTAATVTYVRSGGNISYSVYGAGQTSSLNPNGGVLAGFVEGAQKVADARGQLNTIATDFTTAVNAFQTGGEDQQGNPGVAMFTVGATPTDLSLAITDPRGIAAASVGGGARDNTNLQMLANARTTGKFDTGISDLVTANGSALLAKSQIADAQTAIRGNMVTLRDQSSGVNMDEEAVDLMRFQQAYQASSRVIQIARETLNSIFEVM